MSCRTAIAVVLLAIAEARPLGADGFFVQQMNKVQADIREPLQKALIVFRNGMEDLVLSVRFEGASQEFGWIVPLPVPPEMSAEDSALFEALSRATLVPEVGRSKYSTTRETPGPSYEPPMPSSAAETLDAKVEVIEERTVGVYRMAVLRASAGESLAAWLVTNGFQAPPGGDRILDKYIRKGWVFVAMKISPKASRKRAEADLRAGTIQPIRFRFPVDSPLFPLEVSALNPGEAEVLLYVVSPEALVPREARSTWDCGVFSSRKLLDLPVKDPEAGRPERLLPSDLSGLMLVKCRARFTPESMRDVAFRTYDPSEELASKRLEDRLQAMTYLGRRPPAGAAHEILQVLARQPDREEAVTALWALGEIGGEEAKHALFERARPGSDTRVEALDALRRLGAREVLPVFVDSMAAEYASERRTSLDPGLLALSFDSLLALGDKPSTAALREIALGRAILAAGALSRKAEPVRLRDDPDGRLILVLAAAGDGEAQDRLAEAIVAGSKATADDRVEASKLPAYFWRDIVSSPNGGWSRLAYYWPVLDDTIVALGGRDAPCESILRRALDASDLNDVARSILVANLKAPTEADFQVLHEIWSRAIRPPVRTLELAAAETAKGTKARVRYNYRAVAAMMAFLQEERFEDLLRLWKSAPRDDPTLRVELVQALAQSDDPARVFPLAYEVEPGDGYWRIAEKFYGPAQGKHHQVIAKANGDASLVPGMSVKIPPPPDSPAAEALALAGK